MADTGPEGGPLVEVRWRSGNQLELRYDERASFEGGTRWAMSRSTSVLQRLMSSTIGMLAVARTAPSRLLRPALLSRRRQKHASRQLAGGRTATLGRMVKHMRMQILLSSSALVLSLLCRSGMCASDGFSAVRCGSDIPAELIGQTMKNERIVVIEERHKNLGLKDLGGTEISERLFLISWKICGDEYDLLEENGIVRDVLKSPPHSRQAPKFIGSCQIHSHELPDSIIAVLDRKEGAEMLRARFAWKIDEKRAKFVKLSTEGLLCPRSGVITADGGL